MTDDPVARVGHLIAATGDPAWEQSDWLRSMRMLISAEVIPTIASLVEAVGGLEALLQTQARDLTPADIGMVPVRMRWPVARVFASLDVLALHLPTSVHRRHAEVVRAALDAQAAEIARLRREMTLRERQL